MYLPTDGFGGTIVVVSIVVIVQKSIKKKIGISTSGPRMYFSKKRF